MLRRCWSTLFIRCLGLGVDPKYPTDGKILILVSNYTFFSPLVDFIYSAERMCQKLHTCVVYDSIKTYENKRTHEGGIHVSAHSVY